MNESGLADQRPIAALIGIAPDPGTIWEDLRVGELKTLLALAVGNEEATREGCDWIRHFEQIAPERRLVYRCIENLLRLCDSGDYEPYRSALGALYGAAALERAEALLSRRERFFSLDAPGAGLSGFDLHHRLLEAYEKVHRQHGAAA